MAFSQTINLIISGEDHGASAALEAVAGGVGGLGGGLSALAGPAGIGLAAIGAVGAGAAAVGLAAFNASQDFDQAMHLFQAQTGATDAEMAGFRDTALDVFNNNWGESLEDVGSAMATVRSITQATGDDLGELTTQGLILRDVFGYDLVESSRAADTAMENFGITGQEVMDLITATAQATGDPMGDLLDTVNEYSADFAEAGFSASDMFNILTAGADAGIFSMDKTADAVREFNTRLVDGSSSTREVFDLLGSGGAFMSSLWEAGVISYEDYMAALQDPAGIDAVDALSMALETGALDGASAMQLMIDQLEDMDDPIARDAAGVALFGSMWEDLGADAILALNDVEDSLGDVSGATLAAGDTISQGPGAAWEQFKRTITTSLLPLGDWLSDMLMTMTPHLQALADWLAVKIPVATEALRSWWVDTAWPQIMAAADWIETNIMPHLRTLGQWFLDEGVPALQALAADIMSVLVPGLQQLFIWGQQLATAAMPILGAAVTWVRDNFDTLKPVLIAVGALVLLLTAPILIVAGLIIAFAAAYNQNWYGIRDTTDLVVARITELWNNFQLLIGAFGAWFEVNVKTPWQENWTQMEAIWTTAKANIEAVWAGFKLTLAAFSTWFDTNVKTPWQNNLTQMQAIWATAKTNIEAAWNGFKATVETVWAILQPIFDAIRGFAAWLSGVSFDFNFNIPDVPDWMIPGSPIPLHTAWKNFGEFLDSEQFQPDLVAPEPLFPGAATAAAGNVGAQTLLASAGGGRQIAIGEIHIHNREAMELLLEFLNGTVDEEALGVF